MDRDFYRAQLPDTHIVLGMPLLPLSLGHLILLTRLESPFIVGGEPNWSNLAASVLICAQSYEDGLASLDEPKDRMDRFMRRWHDRITGNDRWSVRLRFKSPNILNLFSECSAFRTYIESNSKGPNFSYDPGNFKPLNCPSEQIIKVALMRDLHFSESEVLNRSWLMCLWDYTTLRTLAGQVSMVDDESIQDAKNVAEELMRLVKEGRVNGYSQPAR